jgi:hypothetical protein
MQKKLSFILSFMVFVSFISSSRSDAGFGDWSATKKVGMLAGVCSILGAGQYAKNLNEEYAKEKKAPDAKMTAVKIATGGLLLVGSDILLFDTHDTQDNLLKLAAFGASLLAGTDMVANGVKYIPCLGGILTGPIDKHGEETKDAGAAARVLLTYVPLRDTLLGYFGSKSSSSLIVK